MLDKEDIKKIIEAQELVFATKNDLHNIKDDIFQFKSEILTGQDQILAKLDVLLGDKTVGDEQDKRKTKVLQIHNDALKSSKILSEKQSVEIDGLRAF
jgi:hypothetical protein